jgi:hypothetical protein
MARWSEIESAAPKLAGRVLARFDAGRHKVLATLRQDGSPRVSGIESSFAGADLWFGGMADSRKVLDLLRDPRFALHSASVDPPAWTGNAKVAGRAVAVTDPAELTAVIAAEGEPPGPARYFRAEITELVLTHLGDPADHLVIEFWREGEGLRRVERR